MSREFLIGLMTGLIIGWIIEWIIDWAYWRKRYISLEKKISNKKDDLKKIKGIGPIIEKRLNQAGVFTYKKLSKLDSSDLEAIVGNAERLADEKDMIKQAKKFTKKRKG
jgi:predicted flap endonuclease-1-like 5' DNA nuclease